MEESCQHKRLRPVATFPDTDNGKAQRVALIRIHCNDCDKPFEFVGIEGPGALISSDRRQLLLAISEARDGLIWDLGKP